MMATPIASALPAMVLVFALTGFAVAQNETAKAPGNTPDKVYELRMYTCNEGKLPLLHARFRDHSIALLARHGMKSLYYWTISEGATTDGEDAKNMLVYILEHKSREAADASWAAFRADPEWVAVKAKSEEGGPLLSKNPVSIFMTATEFCPPDEAENGKSDAPARLFELRKYNVGPSGLPGTVDRFKAGEAELFRKHGMTTVSFWTAMDDSAFIYLLAHKDRETSRTAWNAFFTDFRQFQTEYNARRGPATRGAGGAARGGRGGGGGNEIRFLVPTDYSPRK